MSLWNPAEPQPQSQKEAEGMQMKKQETPIHKKQTASWQPKARVINFYLCKLQK